VGHNKTNRDKKQPKARLQVHLLNVRKIIDNSVSLC